jgi:hypothetical protein
LGVCIELVGDEEFADSCSGELEADFLLIGGKVGSRKPLKTRREEETEKNEMRGSMQKGNLLQ